jgi:hypothetical protein
MIQVVVGVQAGSRLTFDFVMLVILARFAPFLLLLS